jgi:predicted transcriptional regulator
MSERVPYATKVDRELRDKLTKLSEDTRIPQSKLVDEALEDLFLKYGEKESK